MKKGIINTNKPLVYFITGAIAVLAMSILLSKIEKANKQYVPDKIQNNTTANATSTNEPVILYELPTISNPAGSSGDSILLRIKYSAATPNAEILNVSLEPSQSKNNGEYDYFLISKNNEQIKFTFYYANGNLENARLTSVNLPPEASRGGVTTYAVLSKKGEEILFEFHWLADGEIDYVHVSPRLDPFEK